ncbi:MAG: 2-oxo acid dehydrogenase subunit E2 [Planctomycetes bacterium]|nr:2-oxo acid dehydrogenase subunit E2 [Planctomycetota bacterium]
MYTIILPQAEKDMRTATVARWLKRPGEQVAEGEPIVEIETEHSLMQVCCSRAGSLGEILAPEGATLAVGEPLARLAGADEALPAGTPTAAGRKSADPPTVAVTPVLMPKVGNTMEEGTIVAWHVKEGDEIIKGQVLFEAETDKAVVEIEAVEAGTLARIIAVAGSTVEVYRPVAYLAGSDAEVDAYLIAQASVSDAPVPVSRGESKAVVAPAPAATASSAAEATHGRVKASPAARRLAADRGIKLAALYPGSGPGGRIVTSDVPVGAPAGWPTSPGAPPLQPQSGRVLVPMSPMRKAISANLLRSKQTIPHFYIELTVDAGPMMSFQAAEKSRYRCTVTDVVLAACAKTVGEFPAFRRRIEADKYIEFPTANIGIAVGLEDGLVVPVLVAADRLTLRELTAKARLIVEAARSGRVEAMGQGVLTITNLGMFGIERFSAIINPPEAAILAVGAVREEAVVCDGALRPGRRMTMTLSCDHRIIDGVAAAKFLARCKELLEAPQLLPK